MPAECTANPLQRELADSIIRMQPLDEIRILLACGAKPNEPVTQGLRPLHYAVWQRYSDAVQLLLVRGADVDATDECGYSALHLAAEHGYHDLVKLLLKCGAKVDHREDTAEPFPRSVCIRAAGTGRGPRLPSPRPPWLSIGSVVWPSFGFLSFHRDP
jgi:ankyrin repeat protein